MVSGGGMTVVKLASSEHDFRYDIPTVGPEKISTLGESGGSVIAVEAGRCFLLDAAVVSRLCDEKGITLISARESGNGEVLWP
jgi:DUF1009 family protein